MRVLEISNHPARTTHATRRAGPGVGAPLQWRGTDSATGRRPSSPLRRGGTKCRGGLFHCAGDGGEAACGTCGCSDTYGEWSSPDTNGVVRRTVTRYNNSARYYSCENPNIMWRHILRQWDNMHPVPIVSIGGLTPISYQKHTRQIHHR